ncbi:SPOR domain-containing protein [Marinobacterium arenosum]|uniref:SPOR domain-containing protein n=1 Tax=Marinobacterium arenosum TaxID=2862496 RepID=UPI001C960A82|nr:SPOR domain-containing protein [Marinobacterium arenosum]MBY4675140.1 SPOR domain-containing protein [Marinobacterium arenosum]
MSESLKLRLVGLAAIILSAGILFPLFFDGAGYRERHLSNDIPPEPEAPVVISVTPVKQALPDTSELAEPAPAAERPAKSAALQAKIDKSDAKLAIEPDTPTLDQEGVPVAWTLQLASFKDETNARGLRKQLINAGHKVYTRKQAGLVKVYVGPDLQRSNLERLKLELKEKMALDGIIVRFTTQ